MNDPNLFQWIVGGLVGGGVLVLAFIWAELRGLRETLTTLVKADADKSARLVTVEELIARLPCLTPKCPGS